MHQYPLTIQPQQQQLSNSSSFTSHWLQQLDKSPTAATIVNNKQHFNINYNRPSTFKTNTERINHILSHIVPNNNNNNINTNTPSSLNSPPSSINNNNKALHATHRRTFTQ